MRHIKRSFIRKIGKAGSYLILLLMLSLFLFPFLFLVSTSLKPQTDVISDHPTLFPYPPVLQSYRDMLTYLDFSRLLMNSVTVTLVSVVVSIFLGTMAAYGISRYQCKVSSVMLRSALLVRMVPLASISVVIYTTMNHLHLRDTRIGLMMVYTAICIPFVIWLMVSFLSDIPKELDEAANVDGCGPCSAFIRVILPISLPGLATTTIFTAMTCWNEFLFALLLTSSRTKTVPIGLSEFLTEYNLQLGPMAAGATLFSVPIIFISLFLQKYIVSGMTLGAVKS